MKKKDADLGEITISENTWAVTRDLLRMILEKSLEPNLNRNELRFLILQALNLVEGGKG